MNTTSRIRARGFSLIEVLVAIAILSFGLLALASLQISLMRTSADAKVRTVALALAKDQLETLRNFKDLAGYQALADGSNTPAGPAGTGVTTFTRTWTVNRYVFEDDVDNDGIKNEANDQAFEAYGTDTGATPSGKVTNNEFKVLKVSVTWVDSNGLGQEVAMEDAVAALSPSDSALVAKLGSITTRRNIPVTIFDPAADQMVIPIALGNGVNSAATNPKPQLVVNSSVVETSFDVLTYAGLSGGTATAQQRVETLMVGCTCDYSNTPSDATLRGKRPSFWDGFRYTNPKKATYPIPAGVSASDVSSQSSRCDICCRDHHDPSGTTGATFSPRQNTFNATPAVVTAHPHYLNKDASTPTTTGKYKEACRLIRVDGIFRVAADLENDYFALLRTDNGLDPDVPDYAPDSTTSMGTPTAIPGGAVARYQKFVVEYVDTRFRAPPASATQTTLNTVGDPETLAGSNKYLLNDPTTITAGPTSTRWLHTRGLYVDYLEKEAVDAIKAAKQNSSCTTDTPTLSICILKLLPFTSINLTEIADWSPGPAANLPLSVTNNNYAVNLGSNVVTPTRGEASINAVGLPNSSVDATSYARKWNSGLLDLVFDAISPNDAVYLTDVQNFSIVGTTSPPPAGSGYFTVNLGSYVTTNTAVIVPRLGGVDTPPACNAGNPVTQQQCYVVGSGTAGLGIANSMGINLRYNFKGTKQSQTARDCDGQYGPKAIPVNGQNSYTVNTCPNYRVASAVNVTAGNVAGSVQTSVNDGLLSETTVVNFPQLSHQDVINVTMALESENEQTVTSCTYTCAANQQGTNCQNNTEVFTVISNSCQ
jgi:type IV pilus modification protein PilV